MQPGHLIRRIASAFFLTVTAVAGASGAPAIAADGSLVITGVIDGPLTGGVPKAIEVYAQTDISDLSAFGLGSANNGGGSNGEEFAFPNVSVSAGTFLYVASESTGFTSFFGSAPDYTSAMASINGDDAIELFEDGVVVDIFGDIAVDGSGEAWDYLDGWAKRTDIASAPTTSFDPADWTFSGVNALDGETTNDTAAKPFPVGAQTEPPPVGPRVTLIHEVQGSGSSVAISGEVVVEALVTADFQAGDQLRGFFLQEEDADADADTTTSEAIFVFCGGCPTDVVVGDLVSVAGTTSDFFRMSQITATAAENISVLSSGNALPAPTEIDLPASGSTRASDTFEATEGMVVTFANTMVVSEYFELARYGHLTLTADTRARQFTDANEPDIDGYATFLDELNANRIYLDDDNNIQNDAIGTVDEPYFWPRPGLSTTNFIRGGDTIDALTGVMHWSFAGQGGTDAWRIRPVDESYDYTFTSANARTDAPADVGGSLKVASFNVLNYFTTINARGADSAVELGRQRTKIAAAICGLDADVVGLIEIENNGATAITDLLDGLGGVNETCGTYDFVDTGAIGSDQIAVAFIYRPMTVAGVGDFAILDQSVDARFLDTKNRPALAQTFRQNNGASVTVVVNHLKSKGSSCNDVDDPDVADGQANCNITRSNAAAAMVDWLATDPTGTRSDNVLVIGDLNAYRNEDPIDAIEAGADDVLGTSDDYTDLLDSLIGPAAYSYVFDGQLGYLDHALAGSGLVDEVAGVTVWNINADEIPVFDYNDEIRDGSFEASFERESSALPIYEPKAYRSSDHDPVIVGLDLSAPPVCTTATASIETLLRANHKMVSIDVIGVTDPEDDDVSITIDSIFQDESVNGDDDGNTSPDANGIGTSTAQVRAERSGTGNGRVYHIGFTATDSNGSSCSGEILVSVPLSKGTGPAIDDGPLFDATITP